MGTDFGGPVIWNGTTPTDLSHYFPSPSYAVLNDINDNGWIVGHVYVLGNLEHAFLLTPVPEPETYALFMAGRGLMGFIARRRKSDQA